MSGDAPSLRERVQAARTRSGVSQQAAASALELSPLAYSGIEEGSRQLRGDELVLLAGLLGVRVGAICGLGRAAVQARQAGRAAGSEAGLAAMRSSLDAYFELDGFLARQGFPAGRPAWMPMPRRGRHG